MPASLRFPRGHHRQVPRRSLGPCRSAQVRRCRRSPAGAGGPGRPGRPAGRLGGDEEGTIDREPDAEGNRPGTADPDRAALHRANQAFYDAFEAADLDAMSELWEHSDRVTCVHPGWPARRGWAAVAASWMALFQGPERLQFILTEERVEVVGDVGWVTVDENLLHGPAGGTVAAVNLFVRAGDGWRMVAHHGSPLVG